MSPARVPTPDPTPTPQENDNLFTTENTNFAAAIISAGLLDYDHAERGSAGVQFAFADPYGIGSELERRYNTEVFPRVNPKSYTLARSFLVEEMNRVSPVRRPLVGGGNAKG